MSNLCARDSADRHKAFFINRICRQLGNRRGLFASGNGRLVQDLCAAPSGKTIDCTPYQGLEPVSAVNIFFVHLLRR